MLFGGLNGDGFFNEEYDYDPQYGNELDAGYESPINPSVFHLVRTEVSTEKAVLFRIFAGIDVWVPKKMLVKPHHDLIEAWAYRHVKELIATNCRGCSVDWG